MQENSRKMLTFAVNLVFQKQSSPPIYFFSYDQKRQYHSLEGLNTTRK